MVIDGTEVGQLIEGGVLSTAVTVKLQALVLAQPSVAIIVMVVGTPFDKAVPAAGDCTTLGVPQLSLAVAV